NHVVQAAGRMIRSEVDRGAVVLLDERYRYPMYRECFPPDFRYMTTDDPLPLLEGFFSGDGSAGARLTER
ncbi:MAG TPA: hypothetical protein EYP43_02990, partial [Thermoplasmata archaeon]|nr:hypothetical protein [Thermoplasmata archaeon]